MRGALQNSSGGYPRFAHHGRSAGARRPGGGLADEAHEALEDLARRYAEGAEGAAGVDGDDEPGGTGDEPPERGDGDARRRRLELCRVKVAVEGEVRDLVVVDLVERVAERPGRKARGERAV